VGDTMDSFSGTSAASPLISGAIAAIMSETPGLIAADALAILIYYSDDAGKPGPDEELGAGLPNMRRVMERDTKGIYDIAVNTPYLTTIEPGGDVELVVTLQNRGTENISRVELNVNIDDARYSTFFQNIVVSQSVNENFRIPASSLNAAGNIAVTADATIVGATDTYPNNNSMRINVFFEPKKAE
ncbi:MAG: S8 family serine peptidase, partial [Kiritimatiellae bacterium]|nr:S8 family serine peptidase [Kiritimatiellia bacterium]